MVTIDRLVAQLSCLRRQDLDRWISNAWVRPDGRDGACVFREINVARMRLIQE